MSYSITINGHTANEHNAQVKEIAEEAWAKLRALHRADETPPGFLQEVEHFALRAPEIKRIAEQLRLAGIE
jgi:hypothetical protein